MSAWAVHRVNRLPVESLDLVLPHTSDSLRREPAYEEHLAERAGLLTDALHAAVPALDDAPSLRRAVLKLRRPRACETSCPSRSSPRDSRQASPHLLDHVTAKPLEPQGKAARSVLGHVSRAAVKTSPFSWLTALAVDGGQTDGASHSYVDQQHVHAWLGALARDERFATAFEVEPNRSLRRLGAHAYLLTPAYPGAGESAWRTDALVDASRYVELTPSVPWHRACCWRKWGTWQRGSTCCPGGRERARSVNRLVSRVGSIWTQALSSYLAEGGGRAHFLQRRSPGIPPGPHDVQPVGDAPSRGGVPWNSGVRPTCLGVQVFGAPSGGSGSRDIMNV